MNEGHSALLALALLEEQMGGRPMESAADGDIEQVRERCVFTTHTPIPAGHDKFSWDLVQRVLGEKWVVAIEKMGCLLDGELNMTFLGMFFSHYINGVSMRHEQISQGMFPNYPLNSITNGVHAVTWTSASFSRLYDKHMPEWRKDNRYLRYGVSIPLNEIQHAHAVAKHDLIRMVEERTTVQLDKTVITIGYARRATQYKRANLLFTDPERLRRIAREAGPLQIIYGGKAHPKDESGKELIREIFQAAAELRDDITVVYLEEYDMALAKLMCSGVDLWLNTPQKPHEASGTSGMKAALNGVPSLSILDGWWIEGHVEGVTGWSIGEGWEQESHPERESVSLYDKLEYVILPMFYGRPTAYAQVMRSAITLNGSFFNVQRMMTQYMMNAYPTVDRIEVRG
jgi:starch phosphorylase